MIRCTGAVVHHDEPTAEVLPGCGAPAGQPALDDVPAFWLDAVMAIAFSAPL
ncbi:hypothetical protein [Mycolicibacterium cosmeticum]|uniref:hypothetical protein n=1 Tax=Mycolicibacterium cosmeticum TaxID=258533 RepID=UPI003204F614